jgi:Tol biopolymer transport system component
VGAVCAALAIAATPTNAFAAFPGRDGLIATDDSDGACTGACADSGGPGNQVSTVDPTTRVVNAITSTRIDAQAFEPRWSPSGQLLVFTQFGFPFSDLTIALTDPTGASLRTISLPASLAEPADPTFTADGTHVLFVAQRTVGRRFLYDIYRVGLDGTGLTRVTHLSSRTGLASPTVSSRGRIAFVAGGWIYLIDRAGKAKRLRRGIAPDFSPNGARIVFEDPAKRALETIGVDGKGLRRIVRLPPPDTCSGAALREPSARPAYSPSGRYIVYTRFGDCGRPPAKLVAIRSDGTHSHMILNTDPVQDPNWQSLPG